MLIFVKANHSQIRILCTVYPNGNSKRRIHKIYANCFIYSLITLAHSIVAHSKLQIFEEQHLKLMLL